MRESLANTRLTDTPSLTNNQSETAISAAHRRTLTAAALAAAGCLLVAGCGKSAPAAQAGAPAVWTTAAATAVATPAVTPTESTSTAATPAVTPTDPTSSDATTPNVAATDSVSTGATSADDLTTGGAACTLITQKDVQAVLGKDPGPGSPFASHGASQCQYGDFQTAMVVTNVNPGNGKLLWDHAHSNPQLIHTAPLTDVAGVGDKAFGIYFKGTASIYFLKGDALVLVMVEDNKADSPPKDQAVALAKTAASRM